MAVSAGGTLYGTTTYGGTSNIGTVYSLTPPSSPGDGWTQTVLHSFAGGSDGSYPEGAVVAGKGDVLYGTTYRGGTEDNGTVFSLAPPALPGGAWTETVLHSFAGEPDGSLPEAGLVIGAGGVLYGTTSSGGSGACALGTCGTVFAMTPPASPGGAWTETVLYIFQPGNDGAIPTAALAIGAGGVLYGTTYFGGGTAACSGGCGTVFSLTPPSSAGGTWTEAVLYRFTGSLDGGYPLAGVSIGDTGVLYGTTSYGGSGACSERQDPPGCGAVYAVAPPASPGGEWTETAIYSFKGRGNGLQPRSGVVIGGGGRLYGTTYYGGSGKACYLACGTLFSLTPPVSPDAPWTKSVLHNFTGYPADGGNPIALIFAGGALYGTTFDGGSSAFGAVFKARP